MPYVIQTSPNPDNAHLREGLMKAHLEFLVRNQGVIMAAGGLLEEDGAGAGGLLIIDVPDRQSAESFIQSDPFFRSGLFASVVVKRWRKAFFNFERAP